MIVGCKKACRQIFGDFRPVNVCVGKPAKKMFFSLLFFTIFLWKRAQQNNSKCIQEEGFGIYLVHDCFNELLHDRWKISVPEREKHHFSTAFRR